MVYIPCLQRELVHGRLRRHGRRQFNLCSSYQSDRLLTNVLGILVYLVAGKFASTNPNDALWFSE